VVEFHEISEKEWEKMPPALPPKPPNQWETLLAAVAAGKIVRVKVHPDRIKGMRIGMARVAASRLNMKLEFRTEGDELAIRRSDTPIEPKEPRERKPRRQKAKGEEPEEEEA